MENREENTMTNNRENNYEITENVQLLVDNSALKSECVKINSSTYEGKPCSRFWFRIIALRTLVVLDPETTTTSFKFDQ